MRDDAWHAATSILTALRRSVDATTSSGVSSRSRRSGGHDAADRPRSELLLRLAWDFVDVYVTRNVPPIPTHRQPLRHLRGDASAHGESTAVYWAHSHVPDTVVIPSRVHAAELTLEQQWSERGQQQEAGRASCLLLLMSLAVLGCSRLGGVATRVGTAMGWAAGLLLLLLLGVAASTGAGFRDAFLALQHHDTFVLAAPYVASIAAVSICFVMMTASLLLLKEARLLRGLVVQCRAAGYTAAHFKRLQRQLLRCARDDGLGLRWSDEVAARASASPRGEVDLVALFGMRFVVVNTDDDLSREPFLGEWAAMMSALRRGRLDAVGIDAEWSGPRSTVALLQLSDSKRCFLFRMCFLDRAGLVRDLVSELFALPQVVKCGVGIGQDVQRLRHLLGYFKTAAVIDLRDLAMATGILTDARGACGLDALFRHVTNLPQSWKTVELAQRDWHARDLPLDALRYAANDAVVALVIIRRCVQRLVAHANGENSTAAAFDNAVLAELVKHTIKVPPCV